MLNRIKSYSLLLGIFLLLLFPHQVLAAGTNISNTVSKSRTPDIAVDGNNIYVVWQEGSTNDIAFNYSTDGGSSFEPTQIISGVFPGNAPSIAVSGPNVYVAWETFNGSEVIFTRSTNGGTNFETPQAIAQDPEGITEVQLTAGSSSVYAIWLGFDPQSSQTEVFFTGSTNGGSSFSQTTNISLSPDGSSDDARIATDSSGKDVYIVWVESAPTGPLVEVLLTASHNSGMSFIPTRSLPTNNANIDMSRVATNGNGNIVAVAWRQVGDSPSITDEIMLTQSFNNGNTFNPATNISQSPSVGSIDPDLKMNEIGVISIAWDEATAEKDVLLRQILGSIVGPSINVSQTPEGSFSPSVDIDEAGNSYVAWEERADPPNPEIFFSKVSPQL